MWDDDIGIFTGDHWVDTECGQWSTGARGGDTDTTPQGNSLLGTLHQVEGRLVPNLDSANILQQSGVSVELREC